MDNCVAAIQKDEETGNFILVSGNNRVEIRKTKKLEAFVFNTPDISIDVLHGLKDQWFPEGEYAEYQEIVDQADVVEVKDAEIEDMNKAIAENMLGWMDDHGNCWMEERMAEYVKAKYPDLAEKFSHLFRDDYAEYQEIVDQADVVLADEEQSQVIQDAV